MSCSIVTSCCRARFPQTSKNSNSSQKPGQIVTSCSRGTLPTLRKVPRQLGLRSAAREKVQRECSMSLQMALRQRPARAGLYGPRSGAWAARAGAGLSSHCAQTQTVQQQRAILPDSWKEAKNQRVASKVIAEACKDGKGTQRPQFSQRRPKPSDLSLGIGNCICWSLDSAFGPNQHILTFDFAWPVLLATFRADRRAKPCQTEKSLTVQPTSLWTSVSRSASCLRASNFERSPDVKRPRSEDVPQEEESHHQPRCVDTTVSR